MTDPSERCALCGESLSVWRDRDTPTLCRNCGALIQAASDGEDMDPRVRARYERPRLRVIQGGKR